MTDESFMTEVDILYEEIHAANEKTNSVIAERDAAIEKINSVIAERDAAIAENKELRRQIAKFQGE